MLVEATPGAWWKTAVIYQIYIRSFADANGDGIGDINGIRAHLAYVAGLGVDAIWITPWYPSPMADGGYDVADYRAIDPLFGTLDDADALIGEVHRAGLRILIDLVPNHTSSAHAWFKAALAAPRHAAERQRYHFRPGRGPRGSRPPNNWRSVFGGPAWTRVCAAQTGARATGTCTCSRPSSPTSTGTIPKSAPSSNRYCASGWNAASTVSASTWRTA